MKTICTLSIIFVASLSWGQVTIQPLRAEFGKKAHGEFSLTNGGFAPLNVQINIVSAKIQRPVQGEQQQPILETLSPTIHLKMSDYSARIPAHQTHTFAYSMTCDSYPCVAVILADVASGHAKEGTAIVLRLGHVVYACDKAAHCRDKVLFAAN